VIKSNEDINKLGIKVPGEEGSKFYVQNRLEKSLELAEMDVDRVVTFLKSFNFHKTIVNLDMVLILIFLSFVILVLDRYSAKTRSYKGQFALFIICTLSLSYLLLQMDEFFTGFSGINDFCMSMMRQGKRSVSPFQGYGISSLLGCSISNYAFQQLYVNIIAQNSALKIFNNEMYRIGRETVKSTDEAIEVINYLVLLQSSDAKINKVGKLIQKNTEVVKNLLNLNQCSPIREWISSTQRDLCLVSSKRTLVVFFLLLTMMVFLTIIVFLSYSIFGTMVKQQSTKRALNFLYKHEVYQNDAMPR
jgi:flagellar biogenesis protein FliO